MKIYLEREDKKIELKINKIKVDALLEKLKINKTAVLVVRNDSLVSDDAILDDKDNIRILSVVSGG